MSLYAVYPHTWRVTRHRELVVMPRDVQIASSDLPK